MQTDTQNESDDQERIKDFEGFCDLEEKNEGGQNHSTEDESNTLQKKRKREKDEDEKEGEEEGEEEEEKNNCIKLVSENVILYSDSENDKSLKEDSSSNSEENEKYDDFSVYNDQQEQEKEKNDDNYEGMDYDLSCNDNNY